MTVDEEGSTFKVKSEVIVGVAHTAEAVFTPSLLSEKNLVGSDCESLGFETFVSCVVELAGKIIRETETDSV